MSYSEAFEDAHFLRNPVQLQVDAEQRRRAFHASIAERARIAANPQRALAAPVPSDLPMIVIRNPGTAREKLELQSDLFILRTQKIKAERELRSLRAEVVAVRLTRDIREVVAEAYGVTVQEMVGHTRVFHITKPRQIAMYLTCKLTHLSRQQVGKLFGHRDHSTILHAAQKYERLIASDAGIAQEVAALRAMVEPAEISPAPVDAGGAG